MVKKREINTSLLDSVTADMLGGDGVGLLQDDSLRVERILLELVRPDPLQPRRVLPDRIYQSFHGSRMTPTQALRELVQIAQLAARQNGRPFSNVLDLLGNPDDDSQDVIVKLSPEEQLVYDLTNLAITIRDDGQVNPLTVVDVTEGVTQQYRIETGERRYWATWLLRDFVPGYDSDGMIPCIVIPHESASAFRQAKENQALQLRIPRGKSELLYSAMDGITKQRFNQFKDLLRLSDEAIELAERHNIDEYTLRPVLKLDQETQLEMIQHIIQFKL